MNSYINFRNIPKRTYTFILGNFYSLPKRTKDGWGKRIVQFIKTTRKGFNLVDVETGKCIIMGRHMYDSKWSHKNIPSQQKTFKVKIPDWLPCPCEEKNEGEKSA